MKAVVSGYMGGHVAQPSYEAVCGKNTGHAEVIRLDFDATELTVKTILEIFFAIHDPTTPNRQGNDVGPQYRSVIFTTSSAQTQIAKDLIQSLSASNKWSAPMVTELYQVNTDQWKGSTQEVDKTFWPAESYHQDYFRRNPSQGYCVFVVNPKLDKALDAFPHVVQ